MSLNDAEQRCMICRAIGFVLAAIVVGLVTWWLLGKVDGATWFALCVYGWDVQEDTLRLVCAYFGVSFVVFERGV